MLFRSDAEADEIWDGVDKQMEKRHIRDRLKREAEEEAVMKAKTIQSKFADCRNALKDMSEDDWLAIPEVSDMTKKNKRQKREISAQSRFMPVPDSVLLGGASQASSGGGSGAPPEAPHDLRKIGEARGTMLGVRLDQASDSVTGQSVVDPRGFLSGLASVQVSSTSELSDIKKTRSLFQGITASAPKVPRSWIAQARFEESVGKIKRARQVILEGTEKCPLSEDVWLEAARLHPPEVAARLLALAVAKCPEAVNVWSAAAALESDPARRRIVRQRAIEQVPTSLKLWKELIEAEDDPQAAKNLLTRAVGWIPEALELWLALARLSDYAEAKKVLNSARKELPFERGVWIAAMELEESHGKQQVEQVEQVEVTVQDGEQASEADIAAEAEAARWKALHERLGKMAGMAVRTLGQAVSREEWWSTIYECEQQQFPATALALIPVILPLEMQAEEGVEDSIALWEDDANQAETAGHPLCAAGILQVLLQTHGMQCAPSVWEKWLEMLAGLRRVLEDAKGLIPLPHNLWAVYERAVEAHPRSEALWLGYSHCCWSELKVDKAREVLASAFSINPASEDVWLAAVRLELNVGNPSLALALIDRCLQTVPAPSARLWKKAVILRREMQKEEEAQTILRTACLTFPLDPSLLLLSAQICQSRAMQASPSASSFPAMAAATSAAWKAALQSLPSCHFLQMGLAKWMEFGSVPNVPRARSLWEIARHKWPEKPVIFMESLRFEWRQGQMDVGRGLLATGLKLHPQDGLLWMLRVGAAPKREQASRLKEAIAACEKNAPALLLAARLFAEQRKLKQALLFVERALSADDDWGDAWGFLWKCLESQKRMEEQQQQSLEKREEASNSSNASGNVSGYSEAQVQCLQRVERARPRHGEHWIWVSKRVGNRMWDSVAIMKAVSKTFDASIEHELTANWSPEWYRPE